MTKTEFKTLVRHVDRHHVETLGRIEEVKAEVAKVDAKVDAKATERQAERKVKRKGGDEK